MAENVWSAEYPIECSVTLTFKNRKERDAWLKDNHLEPEGLLLRSNLDVRIKRSTALEELAKQAE